MDTDPLFGGCVEGDGTHPTTSLAFFLLTSHVALLRLISDIVNAMPQNTQRRPQQDESPLSALARNMAKGLMGSSVMRGAERAYDVQKSIPPISEIAGEMGHSIDQVARGVRGHADPTLGDVFNTAGALTGGGIAASTATKTPKGAVGMFGGGRALGKSPKGRSNLNIANGMEKAGKSPQEILEATGLSKGAEGRWRFEISDNAAFVKLNAPENPILGDILEHPRLYRYYPDMKNISVKKFTPGVGGIPEGTRGIYYPRWGNQPEKIALPEGVTPVQARSSLLHEGQHAIQFREGFTPGGHDGKDFVERVARAQIKRAENSGDTQLARAYRANLDEFRSWPESTQQREIARIYERMAGEVEARNVQRRQGMSPAERRRSLPADTEDVGRSSQIVLTREELSEALAQGILNRHR